MKRALVVDDVLVHRIHLSSLLIESGIEVEMVSSADEGMGFIHQVSFEWIWLEWCQQSISAIELVQYAREKNPNIRIVGFSSDHQHWILEECHQLAVNRFLTKPITETMVKQTIKMFELS